MEPTTLIPTNQPGQGAGIPPGLPPGTRYEDAYGEFEPEPEDDIPWYKRPMALALLLLVLLALGALIAWLLLSGGDDDAASDDSSLIMVEVTDQDGAPIDTGLLISVEGPAGNELSYQWIRPDDAVAGELTGARTGDDGRFGFEWAIDPDVVDPAAWSATVTLAQPLPAGWAPADALVECVRQRSGESDTIVTMNADVSEGDPATDRVVTYTFPNYQFLAGDTVECEITTVRPVDATTTTAPTTTAPATTVAPTTAAPTTTTTVAPTTVPATTTTVPVVTLPPQPEATLWDVIDNSPDLSSLKALIQLADLVDVFDDPDATLTLLAPTNQAISNAAGGIGAPDFGNSDVVEAVLLTHLNNAEALLSAQLLALNPPEFEVVNPGPHEIDAGASPPTIGEARVVLVDVEASNGVLHVIDRVLLPEELP
jgi:uncharacterized surface protein with fasciclin (FAS1) repeats